MMQKLKTYTQRAARQRARHVRLQYVFIGLVIFVICYVIGCIYFYDQGKQNDMSVPYKPYWKKKLPVLVPCGMKVQNDPIIKVSNLKTYVVGSYVEHRQTEKMIRTVAIVLRSENPEYHCLLCCNGDSIYVPATYDIHSDHFGFEYGTADIICKIPDECTKPTHVAITSQSPKEDSFFQNIHVLQSVYQPVRNQQKQEVFPYDFTVCISTMFDYGNVLMLVQAMEMFKILGVQKVAIYKTSCNEDVQKVLDYYVRHQFVEIIPWTIASYINVSRGWQKKVSPGELHYFGQIAALNDCVYRYMYQSHYVALQDMDEFILPLKLKTCTELLPELEKKYNQPGRFEFENNVFPISIRDSSSKYSPDSWKKIAGDNILEHIVRIRNNPIHFNAIKVIVNPRLVYRTTVHELLDYIMGTVRVDPQIARMYHIRHVPKEKQVGLMQDTHLRDYADSLIPAVLKVLQQVLDT